MNGLRAYRHYMALKKHFSEENYHVIEKPLVMIPEATFFKRNDRALWDKLAGKYESVELLHYMVANFIYGFTQFVYSPEEGEANYKKWIKTKQSLLYIFQNEVSEINPQANASELLSMFMAGKVSIETLAILSYYNTFLDDMVSSLERWELDRIKKARCFIRFDKEKVEEILRDVSVIQ
jgi:hypothetical protein